MKCRLLICVTVFISATGLIGCGRDSSEYQKYRLEEILWSRVPGEPVKCIDQPNSNDSFIVLSKLGIIVESDQKIYLIQVEPTDWAVQRSRISLRDKGAQAICVGNWVRADDYRTDEAKKKARILTITPYHSP